MWGLNRSFTIASYIRHSIYDYLAKNQQCFWIELCMIQKVLNCRRSGLALALRYATVLLHVAERKAIISCSVCKNGILKFFIFVWQTDCSDVPLILEIVIGSHENDQNRSTTARRTSSRINMSAFFFVFFCVPVWQRVPLFVTAINCISHEGSILNQTFHPSLSTLSHWFRYFSVVKINCWIAENPFLSGFAMVPHPCSIGIQVQCLCIRRKLAHFVRARKDHRCKLLALVDALTKWLSVR